MKTLKEKKTANAQTKTVESRKAKTTIKHPRKRKRLCEEKMAENNSSCCYLENLTLIPKKFWINNFYLTRKNQVKKKYLNPYLKKTSGKNDIYYIEHRENKNNAFRIRKDLK